MLLAEQSIRQEHYVSIVKNFVPSQHLHYRSNKSSHWLTSYKDTILHLEEQISSLQSCHFHIPSSVSSFQSARYRYPSMQIIGHGTITNL